ncbi:MAG TPA: RNA polymerase sigma factor, partial [Phototrophicaceae bacterium]|nr:RNA polymerase sigma factor [Phototrophicaceae bacterium]
MQSERESIEGLVRAAQAGDKSSFGVLMDHYQGMIHRVMLTRIDDPETAHDLTQETLLQAYLSLDHLRDPRYFKSWLYGIALNVCHSYLRSHRTNLVSLEALTGGMYHEPANGDPTPEDIVERIELRKLMSQAVDRLTPAAREAVFLFYYEGFSLQEASV